MRLACLLLLLAAAQPCTAFEISNFKAGLACTNTTLNDQSGWVCHETREIFVTDQGRCVYNGERRLCTWTGFEFDYRSDQDGVTLQCGTTLSKPATFGNPGEVLEEDTTSHAFELELSGKHGHFFNPMYYVFSLREPGTPPMVDTMTCRFDGEVVFTYTFNVHSPIAKPGTDVVRPNQ
ncbi:hypothetical protein GCM10011521_21930 [Arenimonas soli]|uniref:Uncharacterized protein n=1 Tax=Arenimonas soli TaxID=2269504 RepID=A0ABQ1HNW8_9GAMM|nr:hypothetical protein [Arenimonas soli]GGA83215.1 hypothetical protein GCM10011521_21930 [Arenimonas soli]